METLKAHRTFGGEVRYLRHQSSSTGGPMDLTVFLPEAALRGEARPALYFLSGLTCTAENFTVKAGAFRHAAEHELVIVAPDTSPRGEGIADDPRYFVGMGAGFYVNATETPWAPQYRMEDYVARELPELVEANLPVTDARGITGHSMGGHGALVLALKNPGRYRAVSALAPICSPSRCPWGEAALGAYLGSDPEAHRAYDASFLVAGASERLPILVDQGLADEFLAEQLKPELLEEACAEAGHPLTLRRREGYDHSYFFVSTFIGEHVAHHARALHG